MCLDELGGGNREHREQGSDRDRVDDNERQIGQPASEFTLKQGTTGKKNLREGNDQ